MCNYLNIFDEFTNVSNLDTVGVVGSTPIARTILKSKPFRNPCKTSTFRAVSDFIQSHHNTSYNPTKRHNTSKCSATCPDDCGKIAVEQFLSLLFSLFGLVERRSAAPRNHTTSLVFVHPITFGCGGGAS
jgi:hypothetical protein